MSGVRISVAMIVRDEAPRIAACLSSLAALGTLRHEVCVYDTGSVDDTVAVAAEHGAAVVRGYWDDDFARARNTAAAPATGDWVFVVDADEQLAHVDPAAVAGALVSAPPDVDVFLVEVVVGDPGRSEYRSWPSPRLYRRGAARYTSPVHTYLERPDGSTPRTAPMPASAMRLRNDGFGAARLEHSWIRVERIATRLIDAVGTDDQQRKHALIDRGRARQGRGEVGAAIADLRAAAALPFTGYEHDLWGLGLLVEVLLGTGQEKEALAWVEHADRLDPGRPAHRWWFAHCLAALRRFPDAVEALDGLPAFEGEFGVRVDEVQIARQQLVWAIDSGDTARIVGALRRLQGLPDARTQEPLYARVLGELSGAGAPARG